MASTSKMTAVRGKYVTRSAYQKLAEENKKLLCDIKILTDENMALMPEQIFLKMKWRKEFKEQKHFTEMLCKFAKEYLKKHPEYDFAKTKKIK